MLSRQFSRIGCRILSQSVFHQTRRGMADLSSNWALFCNAKQTELYAQYRPRYTEEVFKTITDYCAESSNNFYLAVDVGCGSGQSTTPLAKHFKKVIGLDVSALQIAKAPTDIPNVSFKVCQAEDLSFLPAGSADLVTVAQAFHWMDQAKFFAEVDRVLRPGGSVIIYGYSTCDLSPKNANDYFQEFYHTVLPDYWTGGRTSVEQKYLGFSIPYQGWKRNDDLTIEKDLSVDEFVGYMGSWSAITEYNQKHPSQNILETVQQRLSDICQSTDKGSEKKESDLRVTWPVFMLMGHKPK